MGTIKSKPKKKEKKYDASIGRNVIMIGANNSGKSTFFNQIKSMIESVDTSIDEEELQKDAPYYLNELPIISTPLIFDNIDNNLKFDALFDGFMKRKILRKKSFQNITIPNGIKGIIILYLKYGNINHCRLCYHFKYRDQLLCIPNSYYILNLFEVECDEKLLRDSTVSTFIGNLNISLNDILFFFIDSTCFDEISLTDNKNRMIEIIKLYKWTLQDVYKHSIEQIAILSKKDLLIKKIESGISIQQYINTETLNTESVDTKTEIKHLCDAVDNHMAVCLNIFNQEKVKIIFDGELYATIAQDNYYKDLAAING